MVAPIKCRIKHYCCFCVLNFYILLKQQYTDQKEYCTNLVQRQQVKGNIELKIFTLGLQMLPQSKWETLENIIILNLSNSILPG